MSRPNASSEVMPTWGNVRGWPRWLRLPLQRGWWAATAWRRALPDFIIIGAQKCGTSSLYEYLAQHPQIRAARKKEIHFFDSPAFRRGLNWYRAHFPMASTLRAGSLLTGEASPFYLFYPRCHERVFQVVPDVKLIVMMRNPVDRALSHYNHQRRHGREPLSFEDALAAEETRLSGEKERILSEGDYYSYNYWAFSYKARGIYVDQVSRWREIFPARQFLFIRSEDFFADTRRQYRRVLEFLGLSPFDLVSYPKANVGMYSSMRSSTRQELTRLFEAHNRRLEELVGEGMGW